MSDNETLLNDYWTPDGLSAEIGIAQITLARWRARRIGPPVTRIGRRVLYRKTAAREWLLRQESARTA